MLHNLFKKIMISNSNNKSKASEDDNKRSLKRLKTKRICSLDDVLSMEAVEIVRYSEAYWKMLEKMVSEEVAFNEKSKRSGLNMAEELCEIRERVDNLLSTEHILQAHIENMENLHRERLMDAANNN